MFYGIVFINGDNIKIKVSIEKYLYNRVLHNIQVFNYPISNDCLKVSIDGHTEKQVLSKLLLSASISEIHTMMVRPPEEGGLKESI